MNRITAICTFCLSLSLSLMWLPAVRAGNEPCDPGGFKEDLTGALATYKNYPCALPPNFESNSVVAPDEWQQAGINDADVYTIHCPHPTHPESDIRLVFWHAIDGVGVHWVRVEVWGGRNDTRIKRIHVDGLLVGNEKKLRVRIYDYFYGGVLWLSHTSNVSVGDIGHLDVVTPDNEYDGTCVNGTPWRDKVELQNCLESQGFRQSLIYTLIWVHGNSDWVTMGNGDIENIVLGDGNDRLDARLAWRSDSILGGPGNDNIIGTSPGGPHGGEDNLILGMGGNDTIRGHGGNDTIYGGGGADTLYGEDSSFSGTSGNDTIYGGNGTIDYALYSSYVCPDASADGKDRIYGNDGGDQLHGEDDDDTIWGGEGGDNAFGGDGDDTIYGENGNDDLAGDAGTDTIWGGNGNDALSGDDRDEQLPFSVSGADILHGEAGDDDFYGGRKSDCLFGGIGNDWNQTWWTNPPPGEEDEESSIESSSQQGAIPKP